LIEIWAHKPLSDPSRLGCCFALDGSHERIATGSAEESTLKLWDIIAGKEVARIPRNWSGLPGITAIAFSPDGTYIAAGVEVGVVELLDVSQAISVVRDNSVRKK